MPDTLATDRICRRNLALGWVSLAIGVASGLVLGLWSFDGPAPVPQWLGDYDDTSRRMARLGHIAFMGLGFTNILPAGELARRGRAISWRRAASAAMYFGNVLLPLSLFAAAAYRPLKYFLPVPSVAVSVALAIVAFAVCRQLKEAPGEHP